MRFNFHKNINNIICILIFLIIGGLIYSNTLNNPFTFDDTNNIVDNASIKNSSIYYQINQPRYIGIISFALNYKFNKLNPYGYHLANIIIHIMNAICVFFLTKEIATLSPMKIQHKWKEIIPFFSSLIFLVHPIQTQAVNYVVQRETSLAAFFVLISILFYVRFKRYGQIPNYLISLIACLLAFKTKENTATLPLILIVIGFLFFAQEKNYKQIFMNILPYFLLLIVIPLSFINVNKSAGELLGEINRASYATPVISRSTYFFTELNVIISYMKLIMLPVNQSIDYYYPLSQSLFENKTFFSFCLIVMIIILALKMARKYAVISFGIFWFFIFLLVESSIIPIADVIFEHRIYLPSIGFIIGAVRSLFLIENRYKWRILTPILCVIILLLSILAFERNTIWQSEISLWQDASIKFPQNARSFANLGYAYAKQGNCEESIKASKIAIKLDPEQKYAWYNLGGCHWRTNFIVEAINDFNNVLRLDPAASNASCELAKIFMKKHNILFASHVLKRAKDFDSNNVQINALLADAYCQIGNLSEAKKIFEEAKKAGIDSAHFYYNYAICLFKKNEIQESKINFISSLELNPDEIESYYFLALIYEKENDYEKAASYYKMFISKSKEDNNLVADAKKKMNQIMNKSSH